jgi:hypothetical protein
LQWNDINDKNHVKWLKDGNELSLENNEQHSRIEQDRNFQLTIFYVTSEDAGIYDCAAYRDENFKIKSPRRYQLVVDGLLQIKSNSFQCFQIEFESSHS